jgi:hypothetical protein
MIGTYPSTCKSTCTRHTLAYQQNRVGIKVQVEDYQWWRHWWGIPKWVACYVYSMYQWRVPGMNGCHCVSHGKHKGTRCPDEQHRIEVFVNYQWWVPGMYMPLGKHKFTSCSDVQNWIEGCVIYRWRVPGMYMPPSKHRVTSSSDEQNRIAVCAKYTMVGTRDVHAT